MLLKRFGLEVIAITHIFTLMYVTCYHVLQVNVKKVLLSYHHLSHQNQTTNPLPQGHQYCLCEQHWTVNPDAMSARYHGDSYLTSNLQHPMSACHEVLLLAAAPASMTVKSRSQSMYK